MVERRMFEFDESEVREIIDILFSIDPKITLVDFFNEAAALHLWAIREKKAGRIIASVDEEKEKYREISFPILKRVKPE